MLLTGAACIAADADGSDGAYTYSEASATFVEVKKTATFDICGDGRYYYTAELLDSDGDVQKNAVSSAKGSLSEKDGKYTRTLTVTAPKEAGSYVLSVDFFKDYDRKEQVSELTAPLEVVEAVKLTATLSNSGDVAVTLDVYFVVDGEKIEGSEKSVTVKANGTEKVTYDYVAESLDRSTEYYVKSDDATVSGYVNGLGEDYARTFYTSANDYTVHEAVAVVGFLLVLALLAYIYRKPVKNFGKPKARR